MDKLKDFDNHFITKDGKVYNSKTGNYLKPNLRKNGYMLMTIWENGVSYKRYLHRLLAETYLDNKNNKRTVNHKDGNKVNNCLSNLEWATDSENIKHAYANKLNKGTKQITDNDIKTILNRFYNHENLTSICKDYSFVLSVISEGIKRYHTENPNELQKFEDEKAYQKLIRRRNRK